MDGKFLHRFIRRIGERDAMAFEHILRIGNLTAAGIDFGISRIRTALLTDGLQAFGLNGQAEQLVFVRFDHARQVGGFQIVGNQRVIGGADAVLQGEVKTGRRFA